MLLLTALVLALAPHPMAPSQWEAPMPPAKQPYKMSAQGRAWLRDAEGCELTAYQDSRGTWTIGVGHTGTVDGVPIRAGLKVSEATCDALLAADLKDANQAVALAAKERAAKAAGLAPTQPQIDALVSFVFNAGVGAFATSTVRKRFVAGVDAEVPAALLMWTRAGTDADALASRRAREVLIYARGFYLSNSWKAIP